MLSLIVNPSAGGGRASRALPAVQRTLVAHGLEHHLEPTANLEHARELARRAAGAGEPAVAFGGDGLIGAVAGALAGCGGTLGVLPGGRGNDIARVLKIPRDPVQACSVLAAGAVRTLDMGEAGGRAFLGIASCGLDSAVNRIANQARLPLGTLVYGYGLVRALPGWRPAEFTLSLDGDEPRRVRGYSVAAANSGTFGGGMRLAPNASMEDGRLDIVVIGEISKLRYLLMAPTVFFGAHLRQANVEVLQARELAIEADRPFTLYADGDPIAELPVTVRAVPHAVKVLVAR